VYLVRVSLPHACFAFEVDDQGVIVAAAPSARWTLGRRGRELVGYYRQRCGEVTWTKVEQATLSYAGHSLTGSVAELHAAIEALDADTVPESYYQKVLAGREQRSDGRSN
jgi:hypothetical protein